MNEYCHHVSGFFAHRDEAESAFATLIEQGLPRAQMQIYAADATSSSPAQEAKSDGVLQDVLVDGAIGTAVGTGIGALGSVAHVWSGSPGPCIRGASTASRMCTPCSSTSR